MTATITTKRKPPPAALASPARAQLAAVLEQREAAERHLRDLQSGLEASSRACGATDRAHETALLELQEASPLQVAGLKKRVQQLADELEGMHERRHAFDAEIAIARKAVESATYWVDRRAHEVAGTDSAALQLARRVAALHAELRLLVPAAEMINPHLPREMRNENWWPHAYDRPLSSDLSNQWSAAIKRLHHDPHAALPILPKCG
jgi:hypothetical protein